MPQVCADDEGIETKERDDRLAKEIPEVDGEVERRVVPCALCSLHPVNDDLAVRVGRTTAPDSDAIVGKQRIERHFSGGRMTVSIT